MSLAKASTYLCSLMYEGCTLAYRMCIQELSWVSPKCTRISYKRLIRLSGWDVASNMRVELACARERNGLTSIYFPVLFSIFPGCRDPRDQTYTEDRVRRRKIRANCPIPLKVSPMENCRLTYWLAVRKKLRTVTKARKRPVPAVRTFSSSLSLSSSCDPSLPGLED